MVQQDTGRHINELELFAGFLALQYFASASRNCSIRLNIDNTTAVAHINKSGGYKIASSLRNSAKNRQMQRSEKHKSRGKISTRRT